MSKMTKQSEFKPIGYLDELEPGHYAIQVNKTDGTLQLEAQLIESDPTEDQIKECIVKAESEIRQVYRERDDMLELLKLIADNWSVCRCYDEEHHFDIRGKIKTTLHKRGIKHEV